jgi:hypothetical protein
MPNLVFQYIDRHNSKGGTVYGAFLIYTNERTYVIHSPGRDMHRLYSYVGNGDKGKGRDIISTVMQLPDMTLYPSQYNTLAGQTDDYSTPFPSDKGN